MRILHALAIAGTLFGYCGNGSEAAPSPEQASIVASAAEASPSPDDGRTVYVFTDFQCPFCKKHDDQLRALRVHRPDVHVEIRHHPLPMHPDARLAAKAAIAADGQGKGDVYQHLLFEHQDDLARPALLRLAEVAGCNLDEFVRVMDSESAEDRIVADEKLAKKLGIRGTPTSVVGVHVVEGALPIAEIERHLQ